MLRRTTSFAPLCALDQDGGKGLKMKEAANRGGLPDRKMNERVRHRRAQAHVLAIEEIPVEKHQGYEGHQSWTYHGSRMPAAGCNRVNSQSTAESVNYGGG
jgi:hypothetical protein